MLPMLLAVGSCTIEISEVISEDVTRITCVADDFIFADDEERVSVDGTRSAADVSNPESIAFRWSESDVIGIFPNEGDQIRFPMTDGAGAATATFDGGGWALKNSATYYAYYPFDWENYLPETRKTDIPYSYTGQSAVYDDGSGVINLGGYDYMYVAATTPENGVANLNFHHLGALARVTVTFPETVTYTRLSIIASDRVFPVHGTFDVTANPVTMKVLTSASSIDIDLNNLQGNQGESTGIYFMLPPAACSSLTSLRVKLTDENRNEYDEEIDKKDIESGKAYTWSVFGSVSTEPSPDPAVIDLSESGTANCYIVSHAGKYSFIPTKGNSSESVGTIDKVEVLWETFGTATAPSVGDLVKDVTYSVEDNIVTFTATNREGNALIAAKDANNTVLWSWHIWLTDIPANQIYKNDAGTMMDRNLGATSATPGDVGALGLFYQWGRKDPFLGAQSINSNTKAQSTLGTWPAAVASDESNGTIVYATANPTTFITHNNNNKDWYYSAAEDVTDNARWQSTKTVYDPCPVGYRVPDGGFQGIWANAFDCQSDYLSGAPNFDYANIGFNFGSEGNMNRATLTESETCWYSAAGFLDSYDGGLFDVGDYGYYWSCTPVEYDYGAYALDFNSTGYVGPSYDYYRADGLSVRCLQE